MSDFLTARSYSTDQTWTFYNFTSYLLGNTTKISQNYVRENEITALKRNRRLQNLPLCVVEGSRNESEELSESTSPKLRLENLRAYDLAFSLSHTEATQPLA